MNSSEIRLVRSADKRLRLSDFESDGSDLNQTIRTSGNTGEIDGLIALINDFLASPIGQCNKALVRRTRQKAYDRRRKLKNNNRVNEGGETIMVPKFVELEAKLRQDLDHSVSALREDIAQLRRLLTETAVEGSDIEVGATSSPESGVTAVKDFLATFDLVSFVRYLPAVSAITLAVGLLTWFLVDQMIPLYEASGYSDAEVVAWGAAAMVFGFTLFASLGGNFLARLLLTLAIGYESVFVVSGTLDNDKLSLARSVEANPTLTFLEGVASQKSVEYDRVSKRYLDPDDKVYQNQWYYAKHVKPAQEALNKSHEDALAQRRTLKIESTPNFVMGFTSWMKLLFRLGLVALNVMLIHALIRNVLGWLRFVPAHTGPQITTSRTVL